MHVYEPSALYSERSLRVHWWWSGVEFDHAAAAATMTKMMHNCAQLVHYPPSAGMWRQLPLPIHYPLSADWLRQHMANTRNMHNVKCFATSALWISFFRCHDDIIIYVSTLASFVGVILGANHVVHMRYTQLESRDVCVKYFIFENI